MAPRRNPPRPPGPTPQRPQNVRDGRMPYSGMGATNTAPRFGNQGPMKPNPQQHRPYPGKGPGPRGTTPGYPSPTIPSPTDAPGPIGFPGGPGGESPWSPTNPGGWTQGPSAPGGPSGGRTPPQQGGKPAGQKPGGNPEFRKWWQQSGMKNPGFGPGGQTGMEGLQGITPQGMRGFMRDQFEGGASRAQMNAFANASPRELASLAGPGGGMNTMRNFLGADPNNINQITGWLNQDNQGGATGAQTSLFGAAPGFYDAYRTQLGADAPVNTMYGMPGSEGYQGLNPTSTPNPLGQAGGPDAPGYPGGFNGTGYNQPGASPPPMQGGPANPWGPVQGQYPGNPYGNMQPPRRNRPGRRY